jgi:hypothetical protein
VSSRQFYFGTLELITVVKPVDEQRPTSQA